MMLMPMENCARARAGMESSIPAKRTVLREQILKVFICNRLSGAIERDPWRSRLAIVMMPQDCETSGAKLSGTHARIWSILVNGGETRT